VSHATELQRDHQRIFSTRHQASLAAHSEFDLNNVLSARMKNSHQKRVLFIDDQAPHTWLGSGFPRSRSILQTFVQQKHFVTFYPLSFFDEEWTSVYKDMPAEVEVMIGYGPTLLEAFLRARQKYYDILFISRPHNMKLLKPILDAHAEWFHDMDIIYDAEAIFATREITYRQLSGTSLSPDDFNALLKEEVDLASVADCVVAVCEPDARQFRAQGIEDVEIIGHTLEPQPTPRSFDERSGFLFVGAIHEEASPNGDSVIWFLEEVFPKIQATLGHDISLTIAGINKSDRIAQLARAVGPAVRITGYLADLTELYDSTRVFVAPTRYAAGIPHKVHEAVSRGVPVVATPLLASQLGWKNDGPILIGSDAESFAAKCVQLYRDRTLWETLRTAGLARITTECSDEAFRQGLTAALQRLSQPLEIPIDK
jgi:glycosyltransferase involved in cell wall biosynthesis